MLKIYLARPITGCSFDEVSSYYEETRDILREMGYDPIIAMCGKSYFKDEQNFKAEGYKQPLSTDHAIFQRDKWMTHQCDVLLANLIGATKVSIGTCFEISWANYLGKHIVLVMEENNIHQHAFVKEAATVIYNNFQDALDYLSKLAKMEI